MLIVSLPVTVSLIASRRLCRDEDRALLGTLKRLGDTEAARGAIAALLPHRSRHQIVARRRFLMERVDAWLRQRRAAERQGREETETESDGETTDCDTDATTEN